jgi:hypothetical protein
MLSTSGAGLRGHVNRAGNLKRVFRSRIAELHPPRLRCGRGFLSAPGNLLAPMLRESSQHVQHEAVRVRIIAISAEINATLRPRPVELRYRKRGLLPAALLQGGKQLRAVGVLLAALHFRVLLRSTAGVMWRCTAARCASSPKPLAPCRSVLTR